MRWGLVEGDRPGTRQPVFDLVEGILSRRRQSEDAGVRDDRKELMKDRPAQAYGCGAFERRSDDVESCLVGRQVGSVGVDEDVRVEGDQRSIATSRRSDQDTDWAQGVRPPSPKVREASACHSGGNSRRASSRRRASSITLLRVVPDSAAQRRAAAAKSSGNSIVVFTGQPYQTTRKYGSSLQGDGGQGEPSQAVELVVTVCAGTQRWQLGKERARLV